METPASSGLPWDAAKDIPGMDLNAHARRLVPPELTILPGRASSSGLPALTALNRALSADGVATTSGGEAEMNRADRDAYRRVARWYDRIFGGMNAGLRGIGRKMFPPREGMDVLDVGCGTGIQLASYQQAGCHVTGIDASPAMLGVARRRLGERARLDLGDAATMPYPDQAFDLVLATTVLHEMPAAVRAAALGEMKRVLRADGRILLIDFEAGPVRPFRGWITKGVIAASEVAAGRNHHRSYRQYMARGGLPPLLGAQGLSVDQRKTVSGGAIGLYLLHNQFRPPDAGSGS